MATKKKEREKRTLKSGRKCHSRRGATLNENWKKQERREMRKGVWLKTWGEEVFAETRRERGNESEARLGKKAKSKNSREREVIFISSSDCYHHKKQYQESEKNCKQQPTTTDSTSLRLLLFCGTGRWPQPRTVKRRHSQLKGVFIVRNNSCDNVNNNSVNKFGYSNYYNHLFCAVSFSKHLFLDKPSCPRIIKPNVVPENKSNYKFFESQGSNYKVNNNKNNNNNNNNNNNAFSSVCVSIRTITCSENSARCNTTKATTAATTATHPHRCTQDKKRSQLFSPFYPEQTLPPVPSKSAQGYPHLDIIHFSKCYPRWSVVFCRVNTRTMTADLIVRSGGSARRFECRLEFASYENNSNTDANKNTDVSSSSSSPSSSSSLTPFFPGPKNSETKEQKVERHGLVLRPIDNNISVFLLTNIRLKGDGNCFRPGLDAKKSTTKKEELSTELGVGRLITRIRITESAGTKLTENKTLHSERKASHKLTRGKVKNKQRSIVPPSRQYTRRICYWSCCCTEEVEIKKNNTTRVVGENSSKRLTIRSVNTPIRIGTTTSIFEKGKKSFKNCIGACGSSRQLIAGKRRSSSRGNSSHNDEKSSSRRRRRRGRTSGDHLVTRLVVRKFRESKDCQAIVDAKNGSSEPARILFNTNTTTSTEWTLSYLQQTLRMETTSPGILNRQEFLWSILDRRPARDTNNNVHTNPHDFETYNRDNNNHHSQQINADDDDVDVFDNSCRYLSSMQVMCINKGSLHSSATARPLENHQSKPSSQTLNSISTENTSPPSTARSPQSPSCGRHNPLIRPSPPLSVHHHNHHPKQQQKQQQQQHFSYQHKNKNNINISYYYDYYCDYFKKFAKRFKTKRLNRILPYWGNSLLGLLLVFQLVGSPILTSAVPVAKKKLSDEVKGMNYLTNFGYVGGPSQEAENLVSESVKIESIKRFQLFANLPVTGVFDHRTMEMMEKPRCGNSDKPVINDWDTGRRKRYILSESKWGRTNLTFRFLNYTPDINFPKIRKAIYDAFRVWSRVTHLTFTEIMFDSNNGKDADIRIQFAKSFHNDGYPFDGEGIILAHAFFPGEKKGGDTHFDDDEHWTVDSDEGVNLFMVAAHEFGHALGLSHSKTSGSLMYPWYQGKQSKGYQLPQDDVDGIQKLYGVKYGNETFDILVKEFPDNTYDPADNDEPEIVHGNCTHTFDAITKIRGDVYIFKGKYFWRWTSGGLKDSKPILISHFWYHFPEESIDAAFERKRDSKIMFFKGDKYWLYDANHMERGWPMAGRPLVELGLPVDLKKIDAAFTWSFNKRTYLVTNDMYWKFDEMESYMVYDYPRSMTIWHGVPTPLDAAFQFTDNKTYFIKGKHYWEYDDQKMRVKNRAPSGNIAERWMQCPSEHRQPLIKSSSSQKRVQSTMGPLLLFLSFLNKHLLV